MRPAFLIVIVGVALALVVGVDVWGAHTAQHSANLIFNNATRSIELVEDMRWQLHQLAHADDKPTGPILARIDADMIAYAPLATYENEADTWAGVRDLLVLTRDAARRGDFATVRQRDAGISDAFEQLVAINHQETQSLIDQIATDQRTETLGDVIAVLVASIVIAVFAVRLSRTQARERQLITENLQR